MREASHPRPPSVGRGTAAALGLLVAAGGGLAGCGATGAGAEPGTEDRAAYLVSVRQQPRDPVAAAAACTQITDPDLRGECTALVARDLVAAGGDAWAACRGLQPGRWRDLCSFEALDGAGDFGPEVIAACADTGDFRRRCLDHALTRHAAREWAHLAQGDEEAMERWMRMKMDEYGIPAHKSDRMVYGLTGRAIADRLHGATADFSPEACGTASAATCRAAFSAFLRRVGEAPAFATLCRQGIGPDQLRAAALPAWESAAVDDVVDDVPAVLGEVCRARTGEDPRVLASRG